MSSNGDTVRLQFDRLVERARVEEKNCQKTENTYET